MAGKLPRPYANEVAQDNSLMHYVEGGDFASTEIGARPSGRPKNVASEHMKIDHVGKNATK